jgi:hypothetical protein
LSEEQLKLRYSRLERDVLREKNIEADAKNVALAAQIAHFKALSASPPSKPATPTSQPEKRTRLNDQKASTGKTSKTRIAQSAQDESLKMPAQEQDGTTFAISLINTFPSHIRR